MQNQSVAVGVPVDQENLEALEVDGDPHKPGYQNIPQSLPTTSSDQVDINIPLISIIIVGISILCACLTSSFHYVEYDEFGLLKDVYGTVRLSHVYEQGRYFFPLNYDMIIFPAHYIEVDFNEAVFTDTGLEIDVEVGFYYHLPRESIGKIYNEFSLNYHDLVLSNSRTAIKDEAAKIGIDQYIINRTAIEKKFADAVSQELQSKLYIDAPTELFRIGDVILPDSVLETSLESAISIQNNELLKNSQAVALIVAETKRLVTEIDVSTSIVLEYASNEANRVVEQANSYSNQILIKTRGLAISTLLNSLNFSSKNHTLEIIEKFALLDNSEHVILVGESLSQGGAGGGGGAQLQIIV